MEEYNKRRLETAKKYIKKLQIRSKDKENIFSFVNYIAAEGLTPVRQMKYFYTLGTLSRMNDKEFSKMNKQDIVGLVSSINNSDYKEWTKRDFKIVIKRIIKYIREQEGQEFERRQYPKEVSWINTSIKKERKKLPKELLTLEDVKKMAEKSQNLRDRCLVLLLYESGARIGEIMNIQLKDIENDKYGARITLFGKTGARKIRVIASAPSISNWLLEHPGRKYKDNMLFCGINNPKRGKTIDYNSFRKMLCVIADNAGINKPVNPHHFRHSRATDLAKKLTEAQLCQYMGWIIGSREAATYVHLSGRDTDKAILGIYGLIEEDTRHEMMQPIKCPRCGITNDPAAKFCSGCSLGLDEKTIMEYDDQKEIAAKVGFDVQGMLGDHDFMMKMMNMMAQEWDGKEQGKKE